jgi:hypothetical protein
VHCVWCLCESYGNVEVGTAREKGIIFYLFTDTKFSLGIIVQMGG